MYRVLSDQTSASVRERLQDLSVEKHLIILIETRNTEMITFLANSMHNNCQLNVRWRCCRVNILVGAKLEKIKIFVWLLVGSPGGPESRASQYK